ncbi:DNA damage-binding protein 1b [Neonectria ditissima]|uniref:Cytochrome b-c1 complex subunit Rieske, mitochondrial n=1 Tax=Neonectria ditissima TaxID=78410 RepID=A0A0N8H6V5_9HYPO|nr:DNA damage-binding protein 1b [Neonectria ditissima]
MAYVAPIHRATSIRHALRAKLLGPDIEDLVVAKANRLEIWRLTEEGMTCIHTKLIHGTISMLQRLQPKGSETDLLFVGTDRLQYFNLVWNPDTNELDTIDRVVEDTSEPYMRHSQSQNKCLVDPTGRFLAMHLWEGVLNVFRLPTRKGSTTRLEALDQVRLTELWMKTSTFIHSRTGHPKIAFLYKAQADQEEARVAIYRLTKDDKGGEVSKFDPHRDRELDIVVADPLASMLIPIPVDEAKRYHVRNNEGAKAHLGGLLVVGETLLTYFDSQTYTSVSSGLREPKIFVAWAEYDGTHFFLADDYGRLDLLQIETVLEPTGVVVKGMTTTPMKFQDSIAITSRASSLVYMGNNILFLASHQGDSQLFQIDTNTNTMVLIKSLSNNAPFLDFSIMDMGNREGDAQTGNAFSSGQSRIVAGSGAYQNGSLRSIRSGVGLEDKGILDELNGSRGLFTLRSYGSDRVDTLIVSFIAETRIFVFDRDGGIEEVYEFQGMLQDAETLLATSLPNGQILQITSNTAILLDPETRSISNSWKPPLGKSITRASANNKWALLSVDGVTLVSLNLMQNLAARYQEAQHYSSSGQPDQISCIHAARDPPDLGVIGWWSSGRISLIDMASLNPVHGESMRQTEDSATVPRDIALVQLHPPETAGPTLLIAMEDGNVVTFNVSTKGFSVSGRKSVTLGSNPARLHILPQEDGTSNVFATTEHASLIYSSEGRIIYSATTADDATCVAPFDSHAFPDSIVLSTDDHVRICHVDKERLTHVNPLPIYETVRRVAYSPSLKAFGLGCIKKELVESEEIVTSSFKLVDEIVFQQLGKPFIFDASPLEMVECVIRADLPNVNGSSTERFIVGTSFLTDGKVQATGDIQGRILVLGVNEDREVYQMLTHNLKGPCRCLAMMNDEYIVAGLSKTVIVYNYLEETSSSASLQKVASYRPSTVPVDLDISGNTIGVVDLMQSLALVEFIPSQDGSKAKLEERARHYEPGWATSVCHLDDERWLEGDAQGNIIVLQRNANALTEQDRSRLEVTSEINIGEQINRIRKLHVAVNEDSIVSPRAFLASTEGSLYLYGDISPQYQDLLMTFQSRLEPHIRASGNIEFSVWRAFRNEVKESEGPYRFIDGEMVERFLDMDEDTQELCLGSSVAKDVKGPDVRESSELHPRSTGPIKGHQFPSLKLVCSLRPQFSPKTFGKASSADSTKEKTSTSPSTTPSANATTPILTMASLATASRLCLRSAAKPAVPAVRALSTTAMRPDSATASAYSSPFRGETKGSKIPDFGSYVSKNGENKNKLFSYFMVGALGAVSAAGAKSTVQEFLVNMSASADVLAMAKVEVDLSAVPEGKNVVIKWRGKPVFIRHRTQDEIDQANKVNISSLRDPENDSDRAKNPEWLVMLGVCTHLGCVPIGEAGDYGGWFCPCHGSHYDISGRIRKGPAPLNLEIPEYDFPEEGKLVVG